MTVMFKIMVKIVGIKDSSYASRLKRYKEGLKDYALRQINIWTI